MCTKFHAWGLPDQALNDPLPSNFITDIIPRYRQGRHNISKQLFLLKAIRSTRVVAMLAGTCQQKPTLGHSVVESCGARFLAPRTGIAPLSFAPTRTGPKNSKFYGPDPGPTRLYFPRTGPKQFSINLKFKKVSTRTDPKILKYGKYFVLRSKRSNQVSDYNKHMNMPFNKVITSDNMLNNNHSTSSVWEWKASLSPKSQEKMSHTPVKKYPDPDRPETKFPDPTWPENIL